MPTSRSRPRLGNRCFDAARKPGAPHSAPGSPVDRGCLTIETLYHFPPQESARAVAVAVAVRIDDDYFIDKLQPLEPKPAAQ